MRAARDRLRRHRDRRRRCPNNCSLRPAPLADPRFRRLCGQFHALGPRALAELLAEIGAERMLRTDIEQRLEQYVARLDRDRLDALDGAELVALRPLRAR